MLGNKIYYIDTTNRNIGCGVIIGYSVNEQGFDTYGIKTEEGLHLVHLASLCFEAEEKAAERLPEVLAINDEIKNIQKDANHKIDFLLEQLRGKPKYEHLTIKGENMAG